MASRLAINGFGRIGRLFFRQTFGRPDMEVVAINDLGDLDNLAYLLKYDSVYRTWDREVKADPARKMLIVDGKEIQVLQEKDPSALPWKNLEIDIVVESTGLFESFEKARVHILSGAKRAVITAPAKDEETADAKTVLVGINEKDLAISSVTSNGSCTTNATAPVISILSEAIGVKKAVLSTVHAYTATQSIVDGPVRGGKDFRRGRAAAQNISPSTTGAAIAVGRVVPEVAGKFDGLAFRVPVPTVSLADITFLAARPTSVEEVNEILRKAASDSRWQGIVKTVDEQIVSSDLIGDPHGAVVDLSFTKVIDGDLVKILSWYDNEYGYVSTLVRHVSQIARLL